MKNLEFVSNLKKQDKVENIFLFFVVALLKRLKDAQKSMAHSLKMLEKRKNDCMAEGTYDAES